MPRREPEMSQRDAASFAAVAERLVEYAGISPPAWLLRARVFDRMAARGLHDRPLGAYVDLLRGRHGDTELAALAEAARVGETRFFRHHEQTQLLRRRVVPDLAARLTTGQRVVRAWSAGCATGEEAYTLAMLLHEELPQERGFTIEVVGTDLSEAALDVARHGRYPGKRLNEVPPATRRRFLHASAGSQIEVAPTIRRLVRFQQRNLLDVENPREQDLVLCRNVLMYMDARARSAILARLAASLAPGGYLLLGVGEAVPERANRWGLVAHRDVSGLIYQRHLTPDPVEQRNASARERPPVCARLDLRGDEDAPAVASALRDAVLASTPLMVMLDGAVFLGDDVARLFRRAGSVQRQAGGQVVLVAARPGPRRWAIRHGLHRTFRLFEDELSARRALASSGVATRSHG